MIAQQYSTGGAHFAFTDRWGGVSAAPYEQLNLGGAVGDDPGAVAANRSRAAAALGPTAGPVVWMNQVHGADVAVVDGPWPGDAAAVDGLVTAVPGVVLAVLTADCTPVLLADPVARVAGAAHAGRPGLAADVVGVTLEAMAGLGADPARVVARTGPSVCGDCYEVPAALRDEVEALVPGTATETSWGTPAIDIPAGVRSQLLARGVRDVVLSPVCTRESPDHFSYRRDRTTGRLAGYVWTGGDRG
ncbi:peptidoglycan editing factor PgeF [Streptomyces lonarensis]|uniref:Purine nucleoside phosphorylase n=1 Tax=Streptomyces lonarensis TaxID=700599 RepID=A0A7X6D1M3_9ACTN|nr:peptidoglycan editing factor PgeF [Streptomyces lonarensis]NJQ06561.1 peptidoglycan editing factor PgeF [Streptomyces lonarensis]